MANGSSRSTSTATKSASHPTEGTVAVGVKMRRGRSSDRGSMGHPTVSAEAPATPRPKMSGPVPYGADAVAGGCERRFKISEAILPAIGIGPRWSGAT